MPNRDELASNARKADEKRVLTLVSVLLSVVGATTLMVTIFLPSDEGGGLERSIRELSAQLWPFCLTTAAALLVYERSLRKKFVEDLINISGPRIVDALRPSSVIDTLLLRIYGPNPANRDVAVSVLGGEGVTDDDLSVSVDTTVEYSLTGLTDGRYKLTSNITYSYRGSVENDTFVIVATCDPKLRDLIVVGCEFPLFDSWHVLEPELFDQALTELTGNAEISISYVDSEDRHHSTRFEKAQLQEVPVAKWPTYLSFFRHDIGAVKKLDPKKYEHSVRIYECKLSNHTSGTGRTIQRVLGLSLSAPTLQSISDGYCFWTAPYPCYVKSLNFKVSGLLLQQPDLVFRPVVFGLRSPDSDDRWLAYDEISTIPINSWMLPGHGFALMWKNREA